MLSSNRSCPVTTCAAIPATLHATTGGVEDLWKAILHDQLDALPSCVSPRHLAYLRLR